MPQFTSNSIQGVLALMLVPASGLVTQQQIQPLVSFSNTQRTQLGANFPSFDGASWNPKKITEGVFDNLSQSKESLMASMGQQKEAWINSVEQQKEQLQQQQQKLMAELPFHKSDHLGISEGADSVIMGGHKPDIIQMAVQSQGTASGNVAETIASSAASETILPQVLQATTDPSAQMDASNSAMELVASIDKQADLHAAQLEAAKAAVLDNQIPADILDAVMGPQAMNVDTLMASASQDAAPLRDAAVMPIDKVPTGPVDMMTSPAMVSKDIIIPAIDVDSERVGPISTSEVMQALQDVTVNAKQQMSETVASANQFHFLDNQKGFEVKEIGEASADMLQKLANGMVGSMESISQNLMNFVEEVMKGKGGFVTSELLHGAQDSIQKIVNGGIESVMATVNSVGDITLRDMVTSLVSLVALVVKVLFQLVSTLVAAASGKGIASWVDQTNAAIHQGALALQDQAEHFSNDLSHQSLNEMVAMVDSYMHASTTYMAETATTVLNMGEMTGSLAAPLVSAIFTEGVSSTWNALSDKF